VTRSLGLACTVLLLGACHVGNRVYNVAIDPINGSVRLQSIVAVRPTAGQPDAVSPGCVPSLDLLTGYACLAFLEFDDMGEAWDRGQLPEALALIERAKRVDKTKPPIVVVFIHGWKNNASREPDRRNGNVIGFEGVLEHLRTRVYPTFPIVGVYVGWRGDLIPKYWPVRRQFSYFNREEAALRIPGASMTSALVEVATTAHRDRPDAYVLMIGHSFGALVLERTLAQAMADYALRVASNVSPKSGESDGGWSDLVVFLNSAAAATEGKQMLDLLKNRTVFVVPDASGVERPRPLYLSISSLGDAATRFALPIGHGPSFLRHKTNGNFRPYTAANAPQPPVSAQSAYYTSTLAHMQALQSHVILEDGMCGPGNAAVTPFGSAFALPNRRSYQVCEKPARWNDTPYWAMQMPASIVRDHSSIFTEDMVGLLGRFLVSREEMTGARPRLLAAISPARTKPGGDATIRGSHFGNSGSMTLGGRQVTGTDVVNWSDTIVHVRVPKDMPPGQQQVLITAEDGYRQVFPHDSLTVLEP
jgi:hypothetical protein